MSEVYTVKITDHAEEALRELGYYIAYDRMSPLNAINYIKALRDSILELDQMPQRIPLTKEEPWRSYGIHQMVVKSHLVYFWIDEEKKIVQVTDVIYGASDQRKALENMPL